ncbi:MAG: NUDIX domain-containing protein, partial [Clostridia bacterium]|nr:NUDIX domain-containing protein [Clostridia bacterium]
MMQCRIYPAGTFPDCKYVVIFSRYCGELLLSRHRDRLTWETQGGHIEPGETPLQAAYRELYEESGALESGLSHVFDYCVTDAGGTGTGAVFFADIRVLGPIPDS